METPLFVLDFEQVKPSNRNKIFNDEVQHLISQEYDAWFDAVKEDYQTYTHYFAEHNEYGTVEYFPKSDKLHIHKLGNEGWHNKGLRWIIENFEK